jgi:tetratricopeptide (TPR) repeat protein
MLAMPAESDPDVRRGISVLLGNLSLWMAKLPEPIPFDGDLAARAAEAAGVSGIEALCRLYVRPGRLARGRQHLTELARRFAGDSRGLNNAAWYLATAEEPELRDSSQALALARKAVELNPQSPEILNTLGVALYRTADWKGAIEALEKAEALEPDRDLAFNGFFLALARWQLGQKNEARTWYDKAVVWMEKNRPKDEELLRFRAEAAALLGLADLPADVFARP